jgi:hypothetical protein
VMQVEEVFLLHWQKLLSLLDWRRIGDPSSFFFKLLVVGCLMIKPESLQMNFRCYICSLSHMTWQNSACSSLFTKITFTVSWWPLFFFFAVTLFTWQVTRHCS